MNNKILALFLMCLYGMCHGLMAAIPSMAMHFHILLTIVSAYCLYYVCFKLVKP